MPRRAHRPHFKLAVRARPDPFTTVPDAAAILASSPRQVLRLVQAGKLFGLPDPSAPFGLVVLKDDIRKLRAPA